MPSALNSATQADQEAWSTSDAFTSPLRQQFHPSASKAWVMYNPAGVVSAGYNILNIINVAPGDNVVCFTIDFSAATFSAWATAQKNSLGTNVTAINAQVSSANFATDSMRVQTTNGTFALVDPDFTFAGAFGDE